jgi:hypothetical protein
MTATDYSRLRLLDWKPAQPSQSRLLLGRATTELNDLVINDIAIFERDGRRWSQMPSEPARNRDGQIVKDEHGKIRYRTPLRWSTRELQDRFSRALITKIEAQHGLLGVER